MHNFPRYMFFHIATPRQRPAKRKRTIIETRVYSYEVIFSAASRGSATALFGLSRSVRLQSASWCRRVTVGIVAKITPSIQRKRLHPNHPKSTEKRSRIDEKTPLERYRRRNANLGGRPHALGSTGEICGVHVASQNRNQTESEKRHPTKS